MATSAALVHSPAGRTAITGQTSLAQMQNDLIARANRGEYDAALRLGMGYTCGHFGLKVNYDEARKYLKIAAYRDLKTNDLDHTISFCAQSFAIQHKAKLTDAFAQGIFNGQIRKDDADNYFSSYITPHNYMPAKFLYALYFHDVELHKKPPEFTQEDIDLLIKDMTSCVENSFMPALSLSGILHCEGIIDGTPNVQKGLELLKRAANEGGDGLAKLHLGKIYASGLYGVDKDLKEAKRWYTAAKEQSVSGAEVGLKTVAEKLKGSCVLL